ncbi:MAG: TIR domain-containing protein [Cyanothece sp. SIO1E1]|nr:TIR domain-containing protein [Cyanothece sp. SIO1E1]
MPDQAQFDVFLCHNSEDKPEVKQIANQLKQRKIRPWLDEWELRPGFSWQPILEEQIEQIHSAAVFVGKNGLGPWQEQEIESFLREFVDRRCPVIPVLLSNASKEPKLPVFLKGLTWVDFRQQGQDSGSMAKLIWGITGVKPDSQATWTLDSNPIEPKQDLTLLQADDLKSEKGVDYTDLQDLLARQQWKEADQETRKVMLQAAERTEQGYLDSDDIGKFPCVDLRTIDQLWVKYSNGHFGFSVQKKIWKQVGGKVDWETECKLGDRVGWRKNRSWLGYSDLTFSLDAPAGHLPLINVGLVEKSEVLDFLVGFLRRRVFGTMFLIFLLSRRDL